MPASRVALPGDYGRLAIFIDGSNFYHTIRELGLYVDYRRLLDYFKGQGQLLRALYYTALLEGGETPDWLIRLTDWLAYNGYQVVTQPARMVRRKVQDEEGESHWISEIRGNVDLQLAVDMLMLTPHCDTIILFSGDGDFARLVKEVQRRGCRVVIISSQQTQDSTVADELRRQADEFIELRSIADEISMQNQRN